MDIKIGLKECFESLGYSSNFPTSLELNPSTIYVWQQLLNKLKPSNHVNLVRSNIIINRLENQSNFKNPIQYPLPEIQTYNELKSVRKQIETLKASIQEKRSKLNISTQENKSLYLANQSNREKIEEKNVRLHALKLKHENIKKEIEQIDRLLEGRGLITVAEEESLSRDVILNNLQYLVGKIERMANNPVSTKIQTLSVKKPRQNCFSSIKKDTMKSKELHRFRSCNNVNSARSLFPEYHNDNQMNIRSIINKDDEIKFLDQSNELLPDSCFNFRGDDEFLTSFQSSSRFQNKKDDISKDQSVFENSFNFCGQSRSHYLMDLKRKRDYFEQAFSNEDISKRIEDLMNSANKKMIWSTLCAFRENSLQSIRLGLEISRGKISFRNKEVSEEDIVKLNFLYIKNGLLMLKNEKKIKMLKNSISQRKMYIQKQLGDHYRSDNWKALEFQLENIGLDTAIQFIHTEVNNNTRNDHRKMLLEMGTKINKAKEDLLRKVKEVEEYRGSTDDLMQKARTCVNETTLCVKKLNKFIFEPDWVASLTENIHLNEILTFENYSLDFNKQFYYTNKNIFYRDVVRSIIFDESTSNDTLYMVTSLLGHPQCTPEIIFKEILRKMYKLHILESLDFPNVAFQVKKVSLEELQEQEKYVQTVSEALISNIRSTKVNQILNSSSHMKSNMDLWLEMPFKHHISQERLLEGKKYKEYEDKFEYFRNN